ncbi:MAG: hypothetical protein ACRYGI_14435 [Janthinobacterium lividum]
MLTLAMLGIILGLYAFRATVEFPSFDGAMNLNVARSLVAGTGYGFRYDGVFAFPAQTDGPFILPAALVFRLFGLTLFTAQAVSLLYLVAFTGLVMLILHRLEAPLWLASITASACLLTPGMSGIGLGGYGELPMLSWTLAGLLAASGHRSKLFAGLLSGLAVLTKTIALLVVVPALVLCAGLITIRTPHRRSRSLAAMVGGFVGIILAWELFRLAALGSIAAWNDWWSLQYGQAAQQSGIAESRLDPGILFAKLRLHLGILSTLTRISIVPLSAWLILPWLMALRRLTGSRLDRRQQMLLSVLLIWPMLYYTWWLAVTPTNMTWLRRILPGLLLQTCLIGALLPDLLVRLRRHGPKPERIEAKLTGVAMAVVVLIELPMLALGAHPLPEAGWVRRQQDIRQVVTALRALPEDAVIFGVGWWQAPVLALFSGRTIMNFDRWSPSRINALPNAYFVIDDAASTLGANPLEQVFSTTRLTPLVRLHETALYRIDSVDPSLPMRNQSSLLSGFDAGTDPPPHTIGWYPGAGGWAWVEPDSTIRLARTDQTWLIIDGAFFSELFPPSVHARRLHVTASPCIDQDVLITSAGRHRITIPLACAASDKPIPIDIELYLDARMPRLHQLDTDTRNRSFEITRIKLER